MAAGMPKIPGFPGGLPRLGAGGGRAVQAALGLAGGAWALYNSVFSVEGGYRGVVFNKITGVKDKVYMEGVHLIIPWIERPTLYNVRAKPRNIGGQSGSKDLQMVSVTLRVLTYPRTDTLPKLYQELGEDYDERVLPSIVNEVLKSVVAQFNASQLITQRPMVSNLIRTRLQRRTEEFHIVLEDVAITHLEFGAEYKAAVEAKQVAQQDAERAKYVVERAEQDRRRAIVRAEGEAEAARLISEAMANNPNFLQLRQLEAAKYIAKRLARGNNRVYLDSDNLQLNLLAKDVHQTK